MKRNDADQLQHTNTIRLLSYGLVAVFLMALDHRANYLSAFRAQALQLAVPIYQIIDWPQRKAQQLWLWSQSQRQLQRQIAELQRQQLELQAQLLRSSNLERENADLRELLAGVNQTDLQVKLAELVQVEMDPYAHQVIINQGSQAGIRAGMAVTDSHGLIGQVTAVSLTGASVTLITDANHALPVRNLRNGLRTIAYGTGDLDSLSIRDLTANADLQVGDQLVTSGLGGRFPAGLLVATIEQKLSIDSNDRFGRFNARPLAALRQARAVLVVQ